MKGMHRNGFIAKSLPVFLLVLFLPMSVWATDYYVSTTGSDSNTGLAASAWKTITHALSQAASGDSIHVAAGTYSASATGESFPLALKEGVSLLGANRDTTILDGGNAASVVVATGVATGSLSGFTITKGKANLGAGVRVTDSGISITDNIIVANQADSGAGIYASNFSGVISQNTIDSNLASGSGGGIRLVSSNGSVTQNLISRNSAGAGGGIYVADEAAAINKNEIIENTAHMHGGGIYVADFSGTINHNIIRGNQATEGNGGGIYAANFSGSLNNNLIVKNVADSTGGIYAVYFDAGSTIINNTVADNVGTLADAVGGMQVSSVQAVLKNNIFWNNGADDFFGGLVGGTLAELSEETVGISYSLINDYAGQANNIYTDPLFVSAADNDYHLSDASPAIDAGINDGAPAEDLAGDPRPQGAAVDMGAYEYAAGIPSGPSGKLIIKAEKRSRRGTSQPLGNLLVRVYSKAEGSCAAGIGTYWQHYQEIIASCGEPDYSGTTDQTTGMLEFDPIAVGSYVIIGGDGSKRQLGSSANIVEGETVTKHLYQRVREDEESLDEGDNRKRKKKKRKKKRRR
jgi:parallel beta-helix repeat protein/predicted outer membrane repeat protein